MSLPRTPFGSVCHLVNGKAFKPTDWSGAGVPIIRIQNLNGPDKPFNYWAGALDKQVLVKTGDLLLAWSGTPGTSFGAHIWSGPSGILNQHIFRCDLHQKAITKEWARIAVNHRLHRLIEQAHGGVGLQHVTRGMVEELEIPLPPLAEQRRIAEVLDRAEALRAKRRAALAQLDSLTQSLFLDLFGDPVSNPRKWPQENLETVFHFRTGKLDSNAAVASGQYPFFTCSREDFRIDTFAFDCEALLLAGNNASADYSVKHYKGKFNAYQRTYVITLRDERNSYDYSRFVLEHRLTELKRISKGTNTKYLTMELLNRIRVPVPPIELQREFARRVGAVEKLKAAQRASLAELDALFASLQHRAFRGEL
jgi:restriction endonuclease S subunit